MTYLFVQHQVKTYSEFEAVFLSGTSRRSRMGSRGGRIYRDIEDAGNILILLEWEDVEKAKEWVESFEYREAVEWGTGGAKPKVVLMEDVLVVDA